MSTSGKYIYLYLCYEIFYDMLHLDNVLNAIAQPKFEKDALIIGEMKWKTKNRSGLRCALFQAVEHKKLPKWSHSLHFLSAQVSLTSDGKLRMNWAYIWTKVFYELYFVTCTSSVSSTMYYCHLSLVHVIPYAVIERVNIWITGSTEETFGRLAIYYR